jgi:general transcriptional corepressor CYC8
MGAPAPSSALAAAEAAAREREDRTPTAPKRLREWEDDPTKQTNDEIKRQRLDDHAPRPPSVPAMNQASPPSARRSLDVDARRAEEQRRANESYHPSEAAHHPALPSINPQQTPTPAPQNLPRLSEPVKEERREPGPPQIEPASRKMEVDENYDDDGEDEKRPVSKSERESPRSANATSTTITAGGD